MRPASSTARRAAAWVGATVAALALVAVAGAASVAQAAAEDCPLADQAYSVDSPLLDVLLDPRARKLIVDAGLLKPFPPAFAATTPPTFAAIVTARLIADRVGLPADRLASLNARLAKIRITAEARRARCARYDVTGPPVRVPRKRPRILVFDKINGFRDGPSVDAANAALRAMAVRRGWGLVVTGNGAAINAATLKRFDAVVWNNVSGDVLTVGQRQALRAYVEGGGGFAAFHGSGGDPAYFWNWYADKLIGARFLGHPGSPQFQTGRLVVEDRNNPITRGLPPSWRLLEEWYSFKASPRLTGAHVLVTLDESSYHPAEAGQDLRMGDHPIAWTRCVGAGRSFYSAIGHRPENYSDPNSIALLEGGIAWAAGLTRSDCGPTQGRHRRD